MNWSTLPLKRIAQIKAGQSPNSDDVRPLSSGIPFLQGNAEFGREHPTPLSECDVASKHCRKGDVLMSVRAPVGALNVADQRYAIGRGLCAVTGRDCDPRFLWWWLHDQVTNLRSVATGTTYAAVTADDVANLKFPIIDVLQQRRIADFLDVEIATIDRLVELRRKQLSLLDEQWWGSMRAQVSGLAGWPNRNHVGLPWLGKVFDGWPMVSLGKLARFHMGTTFPHDHQGGTSGDFPFIKVADFSAGDDLDTLSTADNWVTRNVARHLAARIVPKMSILYARVGAALLLNQRRLVLTDCVVDDNVRGLEFKVGNPRYWLYLLKLLDLGQLANPGIVPSVNETQVASVKLPLPSLKEQDAIVAALDRQLEGVCRLISVVHQQINLLVERRTALLTAAVTGQIDVTKGVGVS